MTMFEALDGTIVVNGFTLRIEIVPDECHGAPWQEEDGHGPVTDWVSPDDRQDGWLLLESWRNGLGRYYDAPAALEIAKRDGWDAPPFGGTPEEKAFRAVNADYRRLKQWCDGVWSYVGVRVCASRADVELGTASLWGIASDDPCILDIANDLIDNAVAEAFVTLTEINKGD